MADYGCISFANKNRKCFSSWTYPARDGSILTPKVDVFSLGVVALQILDNANFKDFSDISDKYKNSQQSNPKFFQYLKEKIIVPIEGRHTMDEFIKYLEETSLL